MYIKPHKHKPTTTIVTLKNQLLHKKNYTIVQNLCLSALVTFHPNLSQFAPKQLLRRGYDSRGVKRSTLVSWAKDSLSNRPQREWSVVAARPNTAKSNCPDAELPSPKLALIKNGAIKIRSPPHNNSAHLQCESGQTIDNDALPLNGWKRRGGRGNSGRRKSRGRDPDPLNSTSSV